MKSWVLTLRCMGWATGVLGLPLLLAASPPQLVTVLNSSQAPADGGSASSIGPTLSPDGRYVLFASAANNLVAAGGSNGIPAISPQPLNVYLYDRTNHTTTLVSINYSGSGGGNDNSLPVNISTNGRYALFVSTATNLVPNDTNGAADVFVRDLVTSTTILVSVATNGGVGNGPSLGAAMTPDGRFVAFLSGASNLVPGDTNNIPDVFVRDLQSAVTTLASPGAIWAGSSKPGQLPLDSPPDITPDGRYVIFHAIATTNIVPGVTTADDIYVNDLVGGTIVQASAGARAAAQSVLGTTNVAVLNYSISSNGQYVAYEAIPGSLAPFGSFETPVYGGPGLVLRYNLQTGLTDLVSTNATIEDGDNPILDMTPDGRYVAFVANTNGSASSNTCILVWDSVAGTTTLASGNSSNTVPIGSVCDVPTLSPDGRFVAFVSSATGLVTNSLVGTFHVYVRDLQAATTTLVDADTNGVGAILGILPVPSMSDDAQFVAFESQGGSLGPQGGTSAYDVFVRDLSLGTTELISAHSPGLTSYAPNGPSMTSGQVVSADGRFVVFVSDASDLVPNDTNGLTDVFVADLVAGTITLVSVSTNGINSGNGVSRNPLMTSDGRYVVFSSTASDLVPGDTNNAEDVFIRDLQAGTTTLVSVNTNGTGPGNTDSSSPLVSTNGRFVLFYSMATNLATGSFSFAGGPNLFLRDLNAGTTIALTTQGYLTSAQMTPDGHFVAFLSTSYPCYVWDSFQAQRVFTNTVNTATSLDAISPDGNVLFYARGALQSAQFGALNRLANTNWVISSNGLAGSPGLHFSGDGRFLTYAVAQYFPSTTNQVYRYDLVTGSNLLVSRSWITSGPGAGNSDSPDISADGRYVAYRSVAPDIVPNDFNAVEDIFLFDSIAGTTTLVSASRSANQTANNRSLSPVFGGNSQNLVFEAWATDLVLPASYNFSSSLVFLSVASTNSIQPFVATISPGSHYPVLSWPAVPGTSYLVQYKNNLTDPAWSTLGGDITVVAGTAYLQDLTAPATQRFYRVTAY